MRSLTWKVSGALVLVALISVGLTAWLTNINTESTFRDYVSTGNMMYTSSIAGDLGEYYDENGTWSGLQTVIGTYKPASVQRLLVTDENGTVIGDSLDIIVGESIDNTNITGGTAVESSGHTVGYLYILTTGMRGRGNMGGTAMPAAVPQVTPEDDFLDQVNDSLWKVGLITFGVALILGLLLTRQIVRPMKKLIIGVRHITRGNLSYRIKVGSRDEIVELADSFNSMASALERGEQARRQMTADIAHELRTPLTVIDGTVNGIMDDVFQPDEEHLSTILEQTSLLTRLINDLRDISKAEAGQLELKKSPTDITELAGRIVSANQVRAAEKDIHLVFSAAGNIPEITVDPFRIEQSVTNLIMNAIRHVSSGGNIDVTVEANEKGINITVADDGEGISPEDLPHVFERFFRSGSSRSRESGGTGLGLAIVKQMVEAHGGTVSVRSTPGNGATFSITLPFAE